MFFIMGFQSILMGLIAELLARTYHSPSKPTYTIRKAINISDGKTSAPNFWYAESLSLTVSIRRLAAARGMPAHIADQFEGWGIPSRW